MITFENRDCMDAMKGFPDNFFDLAIVDPPYGDGLHAEDGEGKGWFTKYNMKLRDQKPYNRFGERFDRYKYDEVNTHTMNESSNAGLRCERAGGLKDTVKK